MNLLLNLVSKILPFIAIGYLAGRLKSGRIENIIKSFVEFSLNILIPLFVFFTVWSIPPSLDILNAGGVILISVSVVTAGAFYASLFSRMFTSKFKDIALPIMFMNSAYLAIPLNAMLFGREGMFLAIVYNIVITFLHFSAGILIVSGSFKEILKLPILYFAAAGIILNILGINMPREISVFSNLLSTVTLPVMLMLVGYQACPVYGSVLLKTSSAVVLRMAGGFFSALLFCEIFGIIDVTRQVCLLTSGMPAAVNSYILAKRYGADFSFAASAISIGLIASLIFIPFILWLM